MRWPVLILMALSVGKAAAAQAEPEPSNQTLLFYNARIALREERPADVLKLWLLRNSLADRGEPGTSDDDFRSVLWAALGRMGICQDGLRKDDAGAGLWPLALHNWVVLALGDNPPPDQPAPWDTFTTGVQQRFVSLNDVLSAEELRSVEFFRSSCFRAQTTMLELGRNRWLDLTDRSSAGALMRQLLEHSKETLAAQKVETLAVIEARIFDLDLALADLAARKARSDGREVASQARSLGVSKAGAAELRETLSRFPETSPQAAFLRRSLTWSPRDWLALSKQRRLFLFEQARPLSKDPEALRRLVLGMVDALVERGEGEEVGIWVAHLAAGDEVELRKHLTAGDRGARLLELEPTSGFRERAVIALHRGVSFMEAGRRQEALRSFAYAMRYAEASREAGAVIALSRRWLSYVLARYETSDDVIATLKALVPRQEYNRVIEDLIWKAALRGDTASFERVTATAHRGSAFDARLHRLRTLASGNAGRLATELRQEIATEPYAVLRFLRELVEQLEADEPSVRTAHVPTMKRLLTVLAPVANPEGEKKNAHARTADALMARIQAILDGLNHLDDSGPGKARALSPQSDLFAGSIRLAPVDALPWPFSAPQAESPSAFAPLKLIPIEWRDGAGNRVFGWRITE